MNEQEQREQVHGRTFKASVFGADVDSLELAALDAAREFFGPGARLEIIRDYTVHHYPGNDCPDQRYHANVTVREVQS